MAALWVLADMKTKGGGAADTTSLALVACLLVPKK